jgi:hypothetical protein
MRQTAERVEKQRSDNRQGENGTIWETRVENIDGWNIGFEKATQMFVKRKGRGAFLFEERLFRDMESQQKKRG